MDKDIDSKSQLTDNPLIESINFSEIRGVMALLFIGLSSASIVIIIEIMLIIVLEKLFWLINSEREEEEEECVINCPRVDNDPHDSITIIELE